jgi:hypothetical protein
MREGSVGPTNGAGDGHGHGLTPNQAQYQPHGFVTDRVGYVPIDQDPAEGRRGGRAAHWARAVLTLVRRGQTAANAKERLLDGADLRSPT